MPPMAQGEADPDGPTREVPLVASLVLETLAWPRPLPAYVIVRLDTDENCSSGSTPGALMRTSHPAARDRVVERFTFQM